MEQVRSTGSYGLALTLLVLALLVGLPVAVWLDLRNLTETSLLRQAKDLNSVVSSVRSYYASNVVGRVLASPAMAADDRVPCTWRLWTGRHRNRASGARHGSEVHPTAGFPCSSAG